MIVGVVSLCAIFEAGCFYQKKCQPVGIFMKRRPVGIGWFSEE